MTVSNVLDCQQCSGRCNWYVIIRYIGQSSCICVCFRVGSSHLVTHICTHAAIQLLYNLWYITCSRIPMDRWMCAICCLSHQGRAFAVCPLYVWWIHRSWKILFFLLLTDSVGPRMGVSQRVVRCQRWNAFRFEEEAYHLWRSQSADMPNAKREFGEHR